MQKDIKTDLTYFLPYTFTAPRVFSLYDTLSTDDYIKLRYGPSYKVEIEGVECIIYTDQLNWFLQLKSVKVNNISGELDSVIVDGTSYKESYQAGFVAGVKCFKEKYSLDKFANLGLEFYISLLKDKCFDGCNEPLCYPGWIGVRRTKVGHISHRIIWGHGYYAGLYSQVEQQMEDYKPIRVALSIVAEKAIADLMDDKENVFNEMHLNKVRTWFIQLTKKKSLGNSMPFLTEQQFNLFVDKAFCKNDSIGMITANLANGELEIMGALFYNYYEKCKHLGFVAKGHQKAYVGLLTENFTNYSHLKDSLYTNFTKYGDRKSAWDNTITLL